ncbi:MAG: hypothetical protein AB4042_11660 [Leptolyngbyaceae cyanobacterium]
MSELEWRSRCWVGRSPLTPELLTKLDQQQYLELNGALAFLRGWCRWTDTV